MHACVQTYMHTDRHIRTYRCIHTHIHNVHSYTHMFIHYIRTYVHIRTYIHARIHSYIHTYIHTYMQQITVDVNGTIHHCKSYAPQVRTGGQTCVCMKSYASEVRTGGQTCVCIHTWTHVVWIYTHQSVIDGMHVCSSDRLYVRLFVVKVGTNMSCNEKKRLYLHAVHVNTNIIQKDNKDFLYM
jgi:hypothetical protein